MSCEQEGQTPGTQSLQIYEDLKQSSTYCLSDVTGNDGSNITGAPPPGHTQDHLEAIHDDSLSPDIRTHKNDVSHTRDNNRTGTPYLTKCMDNGSIIDEGYDTLIYCTNNKLSDTTCTGAHDVLSDICTIGDFQEERIQCTHEAPPVSSLADAVQDHWFFHPFISFKAPEGLARIYDTVVSFQKSNARGARIPLPTSLNLPAWERERTGHIDDIMVIDGVTFGFPLQYMGGPIYAQGDVVENHHSARYYPEAIQQYIVKETSLGTLVGPFDTPPFTPWCHVSPLMSRPKSDSAERRIIVDLSYPDGGINAHIPKNTIAGRPVAHTLPTIQHAIDIIHEQGIENAFMASVDISRAYRNFSTCPADWPLLVIKNNKEYFWDRAMPFGSRMSSYFMTSIANFIIRALHNRGVTALIYLDDILVIGPDESQTETAYKEVLSLLTDLGLPIAHHKLFPPSRKLVWLGICMDLDNNCLSIPDKKLEEMRSNITDIKGCHHLTVRQMQSLIGTINHIGKAVPPARLFMCRLLESLRGAQGDHIDVTPSILADINWFDRYLRDFNGRAIITTATPSIIIEADACLTGMGAHDGRSFYSMPVSERMAQKHSISRIECINCLLAARTLLGEADKGTTVEIRCDNEATIYTYRYGRAKDSVMTACARAMWYLGASLNINFCFVHVPGVNMNVADALSRVFEGGIYVQRVNNFINILGLSGITPDGRNLDYSSFL